MITLPGTITRGGVFCCRRAVYHRGGSRERDPGPMLPTRVTLEQISVSMPDLQPGQLVTLLMAPHSGAAGRVHVRSSPECYGVQLLNGMLVDGVRREQMKLAPCDGGTGYPQLSGGGHTAPGCHGVAPSICQPSATHLQDGAGSDTDEMESDAEGNPNGRSDTEGEGDENSEDDGVEEEEPWDMGTASSSTSTGANGSHSEAAAAAAEDEDEEDADEDDEDEEEEEEEEEAEEEADEEEELQQQQQQQDEEEREQ